MKKLFTVLLLSFLLIFSLSPQSPVEASEHPVIYYIPHPDDEVLSFGLSIFSHLQAGKDVHLVLLTNGEASRVKHKLKMDDQEFADARNREFRMSAQKLGVPKENLHFMNYADGRVLQSEMEYVIGEFEAAYPGASHKAFSWTDPHPDHANSGKALKALADRGVVSDARYHVKYQDVKRAPSRIIKTGYKSYYQPFIVAASRVYQLNNPVIGMYGIGYQSVPKSFQFIEKTPVSYYHK